MGLAGQDEHRGSVLVLVMCRKFNFLISPSPAENCTLLSVKKYLWFSKPLMDLL